MLSVMSVQVGGLLGEEPRGARRHSKRVATSHPTRATRRSDQP